MAEVLKPGESCWRIAEANRAAFLIDGLSYFEAFAAAAEKAQHSIIIVGWDINGTARLRGADSDGRPNDLGGLLQHLVSERRGLRAYMLTWDFLMVLASRRELVPAIGGGWASSPAIEFVLDDKHPIGASHHQKIAVIDDSIAFAGGLDFAVQHWDTPEHRFGRPERVAPVGGELPPHHDVQMMVDGEAAAALGAVVRERWQRATGKFIPKAPGPKDNLWPSHVPPDVENVAVGIARTQAAFAKYPGVREIEALYLRAIESAKETIYIENQYFTCTSVAEALAASLARPRGPEIVLVLPGACEGWLEQMTMCSLRNAFLRQMREADRSGRLKILYPHVPENGTHHTIVHSKLIVVDDSFASVGSANLTNRSMFLDTECNLGIESNGDRRIERAIARFRSRLLAEHLGAEPDAVEQAVRDKRSLHAAIEALPRGERRLEPLIEEGAEIGGSIAKTAKGLIDPEPVDLASLRREFRLPNDPARSLHVSGSLAGTLAAALLGLAWVFVLSPLGAPAPGEAMDALRSLPGGPVAVIGLFVAGGLLLVPVTPFIVLAAVLFDPLRAAAVSLLGCLASASASYAVGSAAGKRLVFRIAAADLRRIKQLLGRPGFAAMFLLRLVPLAPYPVVSLIAGASRICFPDFIRGTAVGVLPSIGLVTLLTGQLKRTIELPSFTNLIALIILAVFTAGVIVWVLRRISRLDAPGAAEPVRAGGYFRRREGSLKAGRRRRAPAAHSK